MFIQTIVLNLCIMNKEKNDRAMSFEKNIIMLFIKFIKIIITKE